MAKSWGGAGAWAAEAEQAEAEARAANDSLLSDAFPSLGETVLSSGKATKKKKSQTFSISEFTVGKYVGPGGKTREKNNSRGLSAEEMMMLPTGPRDRSYEEPDAQGGLGGGFSNYGIFRGTDRLGSDKGGDRESRDRGHGVGFDRERDKDSGRGDRAGRDRDGDYRDDGPSRADEAGSWGAHKKPLPATGVSYEGLGGSDRTGRGGYENDGRERGKLSDRDLPSRADGVDNWGSSKKFVPTAHAGGGGDIYDRRGSRGVGVYEEALRRGAYDDPSGGISRADEVDNWGAAKKALPNLVGPDRRHSVGSFESAYRDAGSEGDRWSKREPQSFCDNAVRAAERPRLVLQRRTIPIDSPLPPLLIDRQGENERPATVYTTTSIPGSSVDDATDVQDQHMHMSKPRSNPFGSARPREEVLAEKGQDWRKFDADLEVKRPLSSHSRRSSRPQTPEVGLTEGLPGPRAKPNPFGDARPRNTSVDEKGSKEPNFDLDGSQAQATPKPRGVMEGNATEGS